MKVFKKKIFFFEDQVYCPPHKPLFETTHDKPITKKPFGIFEGVLGRIPTHSVRAPRSLIQLKHEHSNTNSNLKFL